VNAASYLASAAWGLALLASFLGWGRLAAATLGLRERIHVGLELAWGFALVLALGGWLCWFGLAKGPVLAGLVGFGLAGWLLRSRRGPASRAAGSLGLWITLALAAALLGLAYLTGLLDPSYQAPDDHAAYFLHARQIIETGTLHEPFSFRRLASYGGQSFLHALVLVVAPVEQLNLLDKGVCRVAVGIALLAHALARPQRSLLAALVVVYVAVAYHDIALNTSSIFSGVLAFTGLWLTLEYCRRSPERPVANGILSGLAVAATLPLRQSYLLPCALIVLFEHARRWHLARDGRQARELLALATSTALAAGGWALLQLDACGTPLFPLLPGHANPAWAGVLAARSWHELATAAGNFLGWPVLVIPLAVAGLALWPAARDERASLFPLAAAALFAFAAHVVLLAHVHPGDLTRYAAAFLLPTALFAAARATEWLTGAGGAAALRDPRAWLCGAQLLLLLWLLPPVGRLSERATWLASELQPLARIPDPALAARRYERLQGAVPAGEPLLVLLDDPYLLDLARNPVASLDLPGGVGPPPGPWAAGSAAEAAAYFRGLGYRWLGAARPARMPRESAVSLDRWREHATGLRQEWQYDASDTQAWRVMGSSVVRFFEQLEALATSCERSYDDGKRVALDLSRCAFERTAG
jgi:hypothetical protein